MRGSKIHLCCLCVFAAMFIVHAGTPHVIPESTETDGLLGKLMKRSLEDNVCEWRGRAYRAGELFSYRERCVVYDRCECVGEYSVDEVYCWGKFTYLDLRCILAHNLIVQDIRRQRLDH